MYYFITYVHYLAFLSKSVLDIGFLALKQEPCLGEKFETRFCVEFLMGFTVVYNILSSNNRCKIILLYK